MFNYAISLEYGQRAMNNNQKKRLRNLFLQAYLTWLCRRYKTSRPKLYLYEHRPNWWQGYNYRYAGTVSGFYSFESQAPVCKGIHILVGDLTLDKALCRLRHEWRHHWQYIYHNSLLLWWHQHETLYKRFHNQAVCAIEEDAKNFGYHCKWHKSVHDEQLLIAFSEDELSKLTLGYEARILAQRASEFCNGKNGDKVPVLIWVEETAADMPSYRSAWKRKKLSTRAPFCKHIVCLKNS